MIIKRMTMQDFINAKPYFTRNGDRQVVPEKLDEQIKLYGSYPAVVGFMAYDNDKVIGFTYGIWKDFVYADMDFYIEHFHVEQAGVGRTLMRTLLNELDKHEYNEVITCAGMENAVIYENLCKKFRFMYSGGRTMSRSKIT